MKRRVKILIICLASILLLFIILFIFKSSIVGYFLRTALERQSNGDITLNIEDISIKPVANKISLIKPNLIFKNAYLDSAKTITLTHVSFDIIEIDKLNFSDLFFKKLLLAECLIVEKPGIYFIEETGKEHFSFHPEKFFASLSQNKGSGKGLSIAIGEVEIHYGSIRITQDTAQQSLPEIVDFTIILENFNTNPEPAQKADQILFSDDVQFEIKNLHKLFVSGYHLSIDSIHFSTREKRISLSGTSLTPDWFEDKGKNRIALSVKQVELNGINLRELRGKEDLGIRSVIIADGYFTDYLVDTTPTPVDTIRKKGKRKLSEFLHQFRLDTLALNTFQYNLILPAEDTAINVNNIDLSFYNILIDSAIFRDPLSKVFFKKVLFSTG
ncbi:MAG: hypothetical protein U9R60_16925, partial [Bacteroidota bacterium]|nr:hypothetical protein [Bacteroidota bacterium]